MNNIPHFVDIASINQDTIAYLIDRSFFFKSTQKTHDRDSIAKYNGKGLILLFLEPSTRTRVSFRRAALKLAFDIQMLDPNTSSLIKGEKFVENFLNLEKLGFEIAVVRHARSGALHFLKPFVTISLVNAGDGCHEHPSQALLDLVTIKEKMGNLKGLRVGIVGDIIRSRVARSDIQVLKKFGSEVFLIGPPHFVTKAFESLGTNVLYEYGDILKTLDVVIMLRIQTERIEYDPLLSLSWYRENYAMTLERFGSLSTHAIMLHPGPVSLGVEMDEEVLHEKRCLSYEQVENGIYARMAVFDWIMQGRKNKCY